MAFIALPSQHPAWRTFEESRQQCLAWFAHKAMPLWSQNGVDWVGGGFFEKLAHDGAPIDAPRRTRVVARQLYVLAVAERLGWQGDPSPLIRHGLSFLWERLHQPDGTFASAVMPSGQVVNPKFDLYEQAFALFAMATVFGRDPAAHVDLVAGAGDLLHALQAGWRHPAMGFEEANPRELPLRSNPHMHLFEAALQWCEVLSQHGQDAGDWAGLADGLADLALSRLIEPNSGLLTELFDGNWEAAPGDDGTLAEPGHQFEWGWLLSRWCSLRHKDHPQAIAAAQRMVEVAEQHGVDPVRGVAINAFGTDLAWRDADAKLWPQTERVKAWGLLASKAKSPDEAAQLLNRCTGALKGMMQYLGHPMPGAWNEVWLADGSWSREDIRASSFYHVVCALDVIHTLQTQDPA